MCNMFVWKCVYVKMHKPGSVLISCFWYNDKTISISLSLYLSLYESTIIL